jgi:hypothetical protein
VEYVGGDRELSIFYSRKGLALAQTNVGKERGIEKATGSAKLVKGA